DNLSALWFEKPLNDCVKLIASENGGDYFDAINLSNIVLKSSRFLAEGGAKNIARRDGMSTTMLSATTHIGRIPDFYFQAVGSGTGAIAAWEANLRLLEDGRFGKNKMRLMVSQNTPFLPMYDAWKADSRALLPYDDNQARADAEAIDAKVLSNRKPPFSLAGGLYDALKDTRGDVLKVDNSQTKDAQALFERTEGIDIHPAAGVALYSLIESVQNGTVKPDDCVMLNITGGGEKRMKSEKPIWNLKPSNIYPLAPDPDRVVKEAEELFATI
ncbi:MAG: pyridoxal-phosphate dependent enzyme, partial [Bacteroidales bacterium]|nr:pyridoxal-phosphate dependent enzyme [Bacteroidales bacterium]